jgi:hypothetical protein
MAASIANLKKKTPASLSDAGVIDTHGSAD